MTSKEILEGNRLLAEFMDCEYDDISETYDTGILKLVEPYACGDDQFSSLLHDYELDYHCSWDWLMPVVEKIRTLEVVTNVNYNIIGDFIIEGLTATKVLNIINDRENFKSDLEMCYFGTVEFIKWYNTQSKT